MATTCATGRSCRSSGCTPPNPHSSSKMVRHFVLLRLLESVVRLIVVFAARVSLAQEATRVLQEEEYNLADAEYTMDLKMNLFAIPTSTPSYDHSSNRWRDPYESARDESFTFTAVRAAIQSVLCEMNENIIVVDEDDDSQYSYLCGEEAMDASDLLSYVLLLNSVSAWCSFDSSTDYESCTLSYPVLHIGDNYNMSSLLGDTTTTTTTEEAISLLQTHWQSVLDSHCYDGTFDALLQNYGVEHGQDVTKYCSPFTRQKYHRTKFATQARGAGGKILCSVLWTTFLKWVGMGLPYSAQCW